VTNEEKQIEELGKRFDENVNKFLGRIARGEVSIDDIEVVEVCRSTLPDGSTPFETDDEIGKRLKVALINSAKAASPTSGHPRSMERQRLRSARKAFYVICNG